MAKQTLLWTALPNGYTKDGKFLRVSLLLSPRLDVEASPEELASFPDFVDWPTTIAGSVFVVNFGAQFVKIKGNTFAGNNRIDDQMGRADPSVWSALLPAKTFVKGHEFRDLSKTQVVSFPSANIDSLVRTLYTSLASTAKEDLPKVSTIINNASWRPVLDTIRRMDHDDRFIDFDNGVRKPAALFEAFARGEFSKLPGIAKDLAMFQLFHTPPSRSRIESYKTPQDEAQAQASWLTHEQTELPKRDEFEKKIDFHQIVSAMNQYPTLLRRLGLVVDVLIRRDGFTPAPSAELWVDVELPQGSPGASIASQRTLTLLDDKRFQALPRTTSKSGDYKIVDRMLDLDPKLFSLLQTDVDGAGMKVMNFARSLVILRDKPDKQKDPVSQHEREAGAPSLRNSGLMLAHNGRSDMLKNSFDRQKDFNDKTAANKVVKLSAEDLVRGFRIDIWDDATNNWHSLCQREARYDINDGEKQIDVADEEGTVRLAATTSPDENTNKDLVWLHEMLVAWNGWSLCAPPPGKAIHHHREDPDDPKFDPDKDHVDEVGASEAEVPPGLRLKTAFKALAGSLPRLRYGRSYSIRARVVDLAGNSLTPSPKNLGTEDPKKNPVRYLRFDPIPAPALALFKPSPASVEAPAEGESMERLAIRSFNDTPADNVVATTQRARRVAVPSRTTVKEAEHHGMLDTDGKVDPTFFAMLAAKDNSLSKETIKMAGPLDETPPVETDFAAMQDGEALPYLPDPLTVEFAARLFNHPGIPSTKIIRVPVYDGPKWPDALPFKIELFEDPGASPDFDAATRTLMIPLPKAERATLRLSVKPTRRALNLLGVWNWLTEAQKKALEQMALDGQHWMLTPWRNIELVHAVQRPLIDPDIREHNIVREHRATHARPNFVLNCSIKSTDHIDLLADWNEPFEDTSKPEAGANRARTDHAFSVKITDEKSYVVENQEYIKINGDVIRTGGGFNDRITKIHEFNDTRYRRIEYWFDAATKFREFMPATVLTEVDNGKTVPTDKKIKVTGKKLRTWIPNSAPPPAPDILYVLPTFGWVRSFDQPNKTSWRRGGGLRVYLNRPWNVSGYGEMLAVVLPSASFKKDPSTDPALKNFVTQWGNDPIWLSPFVSGTSPKRTDFPLARTAPDPLGKWLPSFAPIEEADQPIGSPPGHSNQYFNTTGLTHPDLKQPTNETRVEIAPHDVFYDEERQLWYCDIEVNFGSAYYPFIRLALARYQPVSDAQAFLSPIVPAYFMALVPDRWLSVTQTVEPRTQHVSVFGPTYEDSSSHAEAKKASASSSKVAQLAQSSVIEVWVERFDPDWGEDFGWKREPDAIVQRDVKLPGGRLGIEVNKPSLAVQRARAKDLLRAREFTALANERLIDKVFFTPPLWEGSVTLPPVRGEGNRFRLVIAEYEEYLVDDDNPYDQIPTKKDRRLVFIEYVELR